MSLRFSKVTLASENRRTEFLVGGIPKRCADLNGWTAFEKFIDDTPLYQTVRVCANVPVRRRGAGGRHAGRDRLSEQAD